MVRLAPVASRRPLGHRRNSRAGSRAGEPGTGKRPRSASRVGLDGPGQRLPGRGGDYQRGHPSAVQAAESEPEEGVGSTLASGLLLRLDSTELTARAGPGRARAARMV